MDSTQDDRSRGRRIEEALAALLYDRAGRSNRAREALSCWKVACPDAVDLDEAAAAVRRMVLDRTYRGSGGLAEWFPQTLTAWRLAHPADSALEELACRFCASANCSAWQETSAGELGCCLEEAWYRFLSDAEVGDSVTREEEFLSAVVRGLAVTPRASFLWPAAVRAAPGGCFALSQTLVLHAALDGCYRRGPVTPFIAALLLLEPVATAAARFGLSDRDARRVLDTIVAMRLVADPPPLTPER